MTAEQLRTRQPEADEDLARLNAKLAALRSEERVEWALQHLKCECGLHERPTNPYPNTLCNRPGGNDK
jgi:hypothetical protein